MRLFILNVNLCLILSHEIWKAWNRYITKIEPEILKSVTKMYLITNFKINLFIEYMIKLAVQNSKQWSYNSRR